MCYDMILATSIVSFRFLLERPSSTSRALRGVSDKKTMTWTMTMDLSPQDIGLASTILYFKFMLCAYHPIVKNWTKTPCHLIEAFLVAAERL